MIARAVRNSYGENSSSRWKLFLMKKCLCLQWRVLFLFFTNIVNDYCRFFCGETSADGVLVLQLDNEVGISWCA
jgi:hypothetical protein